MKLARRAAALLCACALALCAAAAPAQAAEAGYADLGPDHWAYGEMDRAAALGVLRGMGDGVMSPNTQLTWGQYLALVARAFGAGAYEDALAGGLAWDQAGLAACGDMGLLAEGGFLAEPGEVLDQPITRQDVALLLSRALPRDLEDARYEDGSLEAVTAQERLTDLDTLDETHRAAVERLFNCSVVNGKADGTFGGEDAILRCDGAVLLMRALDRMDRELAGQTRTVTLQVTDLEGNSILPDQEVETTVGAWVDGLLESDRFDELKYYLPQESRVERVSSAGGTYTLTYAPMSEAQREETDFWDALERGEASWEDEWRLEYHRYELGENAYKFNLIFGDPGREQFADKAEAEAQMTAVTFPVWKLDKKGNKYASQATIQVHQAVAEDVAAMFTEIYNDPEQFPIRSIGGYRWSSGKGEHKCGTAIDINPTENYQVRDGKALVGKYWKPGEDPCSMPADGSVVRIMEKYGWSWGGDAWLAWHPNYHDYMHFSYMGG